MQRQKFTKRKKVARGITLQQPKTMRAATVTARGKSTRTGADEQVQIKVDAAVQELLENAYYSDYIGYFENGVLVSCHQTLEQFLERTYDGKLYRLGLSNRFYYLYNDTWFKITPEDVKRGLERKGDRRPAKYYILDWQNACYELGQILWKEASELWGRQVV